jgi:acetoin utilization protein AcuB
MQVDVWMTRRVQAVRPRDSIQHARELMETHRINQLPVVVDGRLVGIITDRDLRDAFPSVFDSTRNQARKRPPNTDPTAILVEDVMTPHVTTLPPKSTVMEAAQIMRRERIGALPIVDHHRLIGLLTRSDILDAFVALNQAGALPLKTQNH